MSASIGAQCFLETERMRRLCTLAALLVVAACSSSQEIESPEGLIRSLVPSPSLTAVLVLDPQHAFECYGALWEWREWGRKHPGQFNLVFSRAPDRAEKHRLALLRVRADMILPDSISSEFPTPAEFVLEQGNIVYRNVGSYGQLTGGVVHLGDGANLEALLRATRQDSARASRSLPQPVRSE